MHGFSFTRYRRKTCHLQRPSMDITLSFLFASIICSGVSGTTVCHDAYSCEENTITETDSGHVQCYGYHSCFEATITVSGSSDISCYGSYSCYKAVDLSIDTTSGDYDIDCWGLFSCAFVDTMYNYDGDIECMGELSCYQSNLEIGTNGGQDYLNVQGDHAAAQSTLTGGYHNQAMGSYSWQNATVYGIFDSSNFNLFGHNAGYGATIICGSGLTCNINCRGNGCNDIALTCDGSCTLNIDCTSAEKSDNCPTGYEIPSFIDLPSLLDIELSTYDNSYNPCFSTITDAINCGDYDECNGDTFNNQSTPVCCTSYQACLLAGNITNSISESDLSSSIIDETAIRCDARFSCDDVTNYIAAKNGGNIYFTGRETTASSTGIIETTNEYNIICSGYRSCYDGKTMRNAKNLFCTGAQSCLDSVMIENIEVVYFYGESAGWTSKIDNIFDSVYCSASTACYQTTISNVNNSLFGGGYSALYKSEITNVTNVCSINIICVVPYYFVLGCVTFDFLFFFVLCVV